MSQIGLVLEGGAMRGLFTSGIIDVLMHHNISFASCVGVSAGATFGCNFKSRQIGRPLRYCKRFAEDWRFCSVSSLLLTGDMFGAEFCYHTLPEQLDRMDVAAFAQNPMNFTIVCTDVVTGKPIYHKSKTIHSKEMEWYRASASMPLVSRIVSIDGLKMLDGGISDSIPLAYHEAQGFRKNVVILTRPADYRKQPNQMMPLVRAKYARYPAFIEAMEQRHIMYNRQTEYVTEQEQNGNAFVIRPSKSLSVSHMTHDAQQMQEVYDIGVQTANAVLPDLQTFLSR